MQRDRQMQMELVIIEFSTDRKVSSLAIKLYLFAARVSVHNGRMSEEHAVLSTTLTEVEEA